MPSLEERDVRQLLLHRHKQVQARTRIKNQLQALALGQGMQKKRKLWSEAGRGGVGEVAAAGHTLDFSTRRERWNDNAGFAGDDTGKLWFGQLL